MNKQFQQFHGVLLSRVWVKDSDAIVTFFSQEQGKISLYCRGVKKAGSKMGPFLQPGAILIGETVKTKTSLPLLKSVQGVFQPEIHDYEALTLFQQSLELTKQLCQEDQVIEPVFTLLSKFLPAFCHYKKHQQLLLAFTLKLFSSIGFLGSLKECSTCHTKLEETKHHFSADHGIICSSCGNLEQSIDFDSIKILAFLQSASFEDIEKLRLSESQISSLNLLFKQFRDKHLNYKLKSED